MNSEIEVHDIVCFSAACERIGVDPDQDRYFRNIIVKLTGYKPDTISRWANGRKSPLPLFRDPNGKIFCFKHDLIKFLSNTRIVSGFKDVYTR